MQYELNHIVQILLGKRDLDEVSGETLAELTREYPYSPILHLLYTKKLQQSQDPRFGESVALTALYFSNPHWLNNLLRPKSSHDALRAMEEAYARTHHGTEGGERPSEPASSPLVSNEAILIPDESGETVTEEPGVPETPIMTEESSMPAAAEPVQVAMPADDIKPHEPERQWEEPEVRILDTVSEGLPPEGPVMDEMDMREPELPEKEAVPAPAVTQETVLAVPTFEVKTPVRKSVPADLIPIEPLYTIDYFASQGIQLTDEEKQDPLGRKLKSFTEWLKTMKKVHPDKTRVSMDEKTEGSIKENAEHSNDRAEVVTEAMAEVYLKQGLAHKAIEMYEKLSLLNPAQSATFAAKIAELKATKP